jgi:hypothetical protein
LTTRDFVADRGPSGRGHSWTRTEHVGTTNGKEKLVRIPLFLKKVGVSADLLHSLGLASILASISLWGRSASQSDKDARARAERLAIFVGLWPPTFFLLGKVLQDIEATPEEQVEQARKRTLEAA